MTGEFIVAGILCAKGYVASLTLKNYPLIDVFVLNTKTKKETSLQVKSMKTDSLNLGAGSSKNCPTTLEGKLNKINKKIKYTHVFVRIKGKKLRDMDFYIVPAQDLKRELKKQNKFWVNKTDHPRKPVTEENMGKNNIAIRVKKPKKYENYPDLSAYKDRWNLIWKKPAK